MTNTRVRASVRPSARTYIMATAPQHNRHDSQHVSHVHTRHVHHRQERPEAEDVAGHGDEQLVEEGRDGEDGHVGGHLFGGCVCVWAWGGGVKGWPSSFLLCLFWVCVCGVDGRGGEGKGLWLCWWVERGRGTGGGGILTFRHRYRHRHQHFHTIYICPLYVPWTPPRGAGGNRRGGRRTGAPACSMCALCVCFLGVWVVLIG